MRTDEAAAPLSHSDRRLGGRFDVLSVVGRTGLTVLCGKHKPARIPGNHGFRDIQESCEDKRTTKRQRQRAVSITVAEGSSCIVSIPVPNGDQSRLPVMTKYG